MSGEGKRKDRLIQTRVPRDLEATLKSEASRRRVTVSHLIRNVLRDAFDLVDGVVADVDRLVSDSVSLAANVGENARRLARPGRAADDADDAEGAIPPEVYAWSEVIVQRPARCSRCDAGLARGVRGFVGLADGRPTPTAWLCRSCVDTLGAA
ncbi:MAG: hypothetical protein ACQGVC_06835 [Myxococcota bacterium]